MSLDDPTNAELVAADAEGAANERVEMNETFAAPLPDRFAFREIRYGLDAAGELQFYFTAHGPAQTLPPGGIDQVIDELLQPAGPSFFTAPLGTAFAAAYNPATPLDLEVTGRSIYIVLRLTRNLFFNPALKAMTHKETAFKPYYGALTHVNAASRDVKPVADCQVIYFVAKPPMPARTHYEHDFNFNIVLRQSRNPTTGEDRAIVIEFDPDVRYPGGSGVGEGP